MMKSEQNTTEKILKILAEHLGVTSEDINEDDSLRVDLHMTPQDLSDFGDLLVEKRFTENEIDLTSIETVGDLVEKLVSEEEFL